MEDSPQEAGGTVVTRANPAEQVNAIPKVPANLAVAMNPDPEAASPVPEKRVFDSRLDELEAIVERGLETFIEVGNALLEIRLCKMYRPAHKTFEDYCRKRWGMSRQRAHQLMDASAVAKNLSTAVDVSPTSERQVRPLAKLEPDQQCEAWEAATKENPTPTAEQVARVVKER